MPFSSPLCSTVTSASSAPGWDPCWQPWWEQCCSSCSTSPCVPPGEPHPLRAAQLAFPQGNKGLMHRILLSAMTFSSISTWMILFLHYLFLWRISGGPLLCDTVLPDVFLGHRYRPTELSFTTSLKICFIKEFPRYLVVPESPAAPQHPSGFIFALGTRYSSSTSFLNAFSNVEGRCLVLMGSDGI